MRPTALARSLMIAVAGTILCSLAARQVQADNMSSSSYQLFFGNFNMTSGTKTSASYGLTDTVGQTAPGQFGAGNNVVKSGFQYIYPLSTFSFKISPQLVAFGSLGINTFQTLQQYLEITTVGAGGYRIKVSEQQPLTSTNGLGNTIPDTNCDTSCSEATAGIWSSTSKYGFGYTMSGDDVVAGFTTSSYYKQFANLALAEQPQTIMSSTSVGEKRHGVLTYRINISASQPTGEYQTTIHYLAVPAF